MTDHAIAPNLKVRRLVASAEADRDRTSMQQRVKGVLVDLGGVVYQGGALIGGAAGALARLREHAIPFRFLTNTTSEPVAAIVAKLRALGIDVVKEEIFTPAAAARRYIAERGLQPFYLVSPALMEDLSGLPTGSTPAVVVGDARKVFTYASLNDAFRRLDSGAELISLASNRMFVDADGRPSLDVGAFVAALEYATGKSAVVLGKPSAAFFRLAVADMGLEPGEVAMVGDDAEFDAVAAVRAGLAGWLVRTGKWRPGCADGLEPQPTAVFDDFEGAVTAVVDGG